MLSVGSRGPGPPEAVDARSGGTVSYSYASLISASVSRRASLIASCGFARAVSKMPAPPGRRVAP